MKQLSQYINIRKGKSTIKATDENIKKIVKDELNRLGRDADLNHIDVSEVTNMENLFSCDGNDLGTKYKDLNPDISQWDVSKVEDMSSMFWVCENFNCDISQWDVSNVKDMSWMFHGCKKFNQDLSKWNVSNVKQMIGMFEYCKNFNQDISQWDVSNTKSYNFMFTACHIKEEFKPHFVK